MSDELKRCPHCQGGIGHDGEPFCLPDCPTRTEPHAIVKALAERGPFLSDTTDCAMCGTTRPFDVSSAEWFAVLTNHEPSCLWRRAKALYP